MSDRIQGTNGDDDISAGSDSSLFELLDGNDTVHTGNGDDTVFGGNGADSIFGGNGDDSLSGETGGDSLSGGNGNNTLEGGDGADSVSGGDGNDLVSGGAGDDHVRGGAGINTLIGGIGDDLYFTNVFSDGHYNTIILNPGDGADKAGRFDAGKDRIDLSAFNTIDGFDDLEFVFVPQEFGSPNLQLNLPGGGSFEFGSIFGGQLTASSFIFATDDSTDPAVVRGTSGDDIRNGNAGNDTLFGFDGADTLSGGERDDLIRGNDGNDSLLGDNGFDQLLGEAGDDTLDGGANGDKLYGGDGNDLLKGGDGHNILYGGAGDDTLIVSQGANDVLLGDAGADLFVINQRAFATINDFTRGDDLIDVTSFGTDYTFDDIELRVSGVHTEVRLDRETELLIFGVTPDQFDASDFVFAVDESSPPPLPAITGTPSDDILSGTRNDDTILGIGGNDKLYGGSGNDSLEGGDGRDLVFGGEGSDTLTGGQGNTDKLTGGGGADTFVLSVGDGEDIIRDFTPGEDLIDLSAFGVSFDDLQIQAIGPHTHISFGRSDTLLLYLTDPVSITSDSFSGLVQQDVQDTPAGAVFTGTDSNDEIIGTDGDDTIDGLAGPDTIGGQQGDDSIIGGAGADQLRGGRGNDTLLGGIGTDRLRGDLGDDLLDGGEGDFDVADFFNALEGVNADLAAGTATGAGNDTLQNIERLEGSAFDDTLRGDALDNVIAGAGGNDLMEGRGGDDLFGIDVGAGNDTVIGGEGNDRLLVVNQDGSELEIEFRSSVLKLGPSQELHIDEVENLEIRNDGSTSIVNTGERLTNVVLDNGDDIYTAAFLDVGHTVDGKGGDDQIRTRNGDDSLNGGDGNDILSASNGQDTLFGGSGNDTLVTHDGERDQLFGGDGNDRLAAGIGDATTVFGGLGADTITSFGHENRIDAGDGNDHITANRSFVDIVAGAGDDFVRSSATESRVYGGEGNDYIVASGSNSEFNGGEGADFIDVTGADHTVRGGAGDDTIDSSGGAETIVVEAGMDFDRITRFEVGSDKIDLSAFSPALSFADLDIEQVGGNTQIDFGNGDVLQLDRFTAANLSAGDFIGFAPEPVAPVATDEADTLNGTGSNDTIDGLAGPDEISGLDGNDSLIGNRGADTLDGGNGNDTLLGGIGTDRLLGREGDDLLDGGDGDFDVADFEFATGSVTADLAAGTAIGDGQDTLQNIERLEGSHHNDTLRGDDQNNVLAGDFGDDLMDGRAGDDLFGIDAQTGNDTVIGGEGRDTLLLDYADGVSDPLVIGADSLYFSDHPGVLQSGDHISTDSVEVLQLQGDQALTIHHRGSRFDEIRLSDGDTIFRTAFNSTSVNVIGGAGVDLIYGGGQDDTLDGGAGRHDRLTGGDGADTFVVRAGNGNDIIRDFQPGVDRIDLTPLALDQEFGDLNIVAVGPHTQIDFGNGDALLLYLTDPSSLEARDFAGLLPTSADLDIEGGPDADTVVGGRGDDELAGRGGPDSVLGGAGQDTLFGGSGADTLDGEDGDDRLFGGIGVDRLRGGRGNDLLDGGEGDFDVADFSQSEQGVVANLTSRQASGNGNDSLRDIERLEGSDFDDTLIGDFRNNVLSGRGGNDLLEGDRGNDLLGADVGTGNDTLIGGEGNDSLLIANPDDTDVTLTVSADGVISGDNGQALTISEIENIEYRGGAGQDDIDLAAFDGDAVVKLGSGDDSASGGEHADIQNGDDGNDTLSGGGGGDTLSGGNGDDLLDGGAGSDRLIGDAGADTLTGGSSGDLFVITPAGGADVITDFEQGLDRIDLTALNLQKPLTQLSISDADGDSVIDLGDGNTVTIRNIAPADLAAGDFVGLQTGDGGAAPDGNLIVNGGFERLSDLRDGLPFGWELVGHEGGALPLLFNESGTFGPSLPSEGRFALEYSRVAEAGSGVAQSVAGLAPGQALNLSLDLLPGDFGGLDHDSRIEIIWNGEVVANVIPTSASPIHVRADLISGSGNGADRLEIVNQHDGTFVRGSLLDNVRLVASDIPASDDFDRVNDGIVTGQSIQGTSDADLLTGLDATTGFKEGDHIHGEGGDDTIEGLNGSDWLAGGDGSDSITGGDGADLVFGGAGQDTMFGGSGADKLQGNAGDDSIFGGDGSDTLFGNEGQDSLFGGAGDDTIVPTDDFESAGPSFIDAGDGNDRVMGSHGEATVIGGAGNDRLESGAGQETFVFAPGSGHDRIERFNPELDRIDLTAFNASFDDLQFDRNVIRLPDGSTIEFGRFFDATTDMASLPEHFVGLSSSGSGGGDPDPAPAPGPGVNLVRNGGFETFAFDRPLDAGISGGDSDPRTFEVPGWEKFGSERASRLVEHGNAIIEDDYSVTFTASRGDPDSGLRQQVDGLTAGQQLTLRFDAHNRGIREDETEMEVRWNGERLSGISEVTEGVNHFSFQVVAGSGDGTDTISFTVPAADRVDNVVVDNVELFFSDGPEPGRQVHQGDKTSDSLTGHAGIDRMIGGDGTDTLEGLGGDDLLSGGQGGDDIDGGDGEDTIHGDEGNDTIRGGNGNDRIFSGDGDDLVEGGAGDDSIRGFLGEETLIGGDGDDTIEIFETGQAFGGGGDDELTAFGSSSVFGGLGNDKVHVFGDVTVEGGAGDDQINLSRSDGATARGGDGDDVFDNRALGNTIDGGSGFDAVSFGSINESLTIDLSAGTATDGTLTTNLSGFEKITGGRNDDLIVGDGAGNLLIGAGGLNTLQGGGGDDTLEGGNDADTIEGGAGADTLYGGRSVDRFVIGSDEDSIDVIVDFEAGERIDVGALGLASTDLQFTDLGDRTRVSANGNGLIDVVKFSSELDADNFIGLTDRIDNIVRLGNSADNVLNGGAGNDTLLGSAGDDTLIGGQGQDELTGGRDNDRFVIDPDDDGVDIITDYDVQGRDAIDFTAFQTSFERLEFVQDGEDTVIRVEGTDRLRLLDHVATDLNRDDFGGLLKHDETLEGDNRVLGSSGNDVFDYFGSGNDTIFGGNGRDLIDGGGGDDDLRGDIERDTIFGGDGNDDVQGGDDDDLLFGGDGNDVIFGGRGPDTLSGGKGVDTLHGSDGRDTFRISADDDGIDLIHFRPFGSIFGGPDVIDISELNIIFADLALTDGVLSANGVDFARVSGMSDLRESFFFGFTDNPLHNPITGTDGADTLDGSDSRELFTAEAGPDLVNAGGGDDTVRGGFGFDTLNGGTGNDLIIAGDGDDHLQGGDGNDQLRGDKGNDTLSGGNGNDDMSGGSGNDEIFGGAGDDTLHSNDGDDLLHGGGGNDQLVGERGNETLVGGSGSNTYRGREGNDLFVLGPADGEADRIHDFRIGEDLIDVSALNVTFDDLTFVQQVGGTALQTGGVIVVTLDNIQSTDLLAEHFTGLLGADEAAAPIEGTDGADTLDGTDGADQIFGGIGPDLLRGGDGSDSLEGGFGFDTLDGGAGADTLTGGGGGDTFVLSADGGVDLITDFNVNQDQLDLGALNTQVAPLTAIQEDADTLLQQGGATIVRLAGVSATDLQFENGQIQSADEFLRATAENRALFGGEGNDTLLGSADNDLLDGGAGDDSLIGGNDSDQLIGGPGNDTMSGGRGRDVFHLNEVGSGFDLITDWGGDLLDVTGLGISFEAIEAIQQGDDLLLRVDGQDLVLLSNTDISDIGRSEIRGTVGHDVLSPGDDLFEGSTLKDVIIHAGPGNDTLIGNDGSDSLDGGADDDLLEGGNHRDTLIGGDGNDSLFGGAKTDKIFGGDGDDVLESGFGSASGFREEVFGGAGDDTIRGHGQVSGGDGHDVINVTRDATIAFGEGGDDVMTAGVLNDSLFGGDGADTLIASTGLNFLAGGAGADVYVVDLDDHDVDSASFVDGEDRIDVQRLGHSIEDFNLVQDGDDVIVMFGRTKLLRLLDQDAADITDDDLINLASTDSPNLIRGPHLEAVLRGGAANDTIFGGDQVDTIFGGAGDDVLAGGRGGGDGNLLNGGAGQDTLIGGLGSNKFVIDDTSETDLILNFDSRDRIDIQSLGIQAEELEFLTVDGPLQVNNGSVEFTLTDPTILVRSGGADIVQVHVNDRTVLETNNFITAPPPDPDAPPEDAIFGADGADTLDGTDGADQIFGGIGPDLLRGGDGDDLLEGGFGFDTLEGGKGADTLTGGAGGDRFVASSDDAIVDLITDFVSGTDTLDLDALSTAFGNLTFEDGDDGVLVLDQGNGVFRLQDVTAADLDESDFSF